MSDTFEQGWAARPFSEQFPELPEDRAAYLDRINSAVTHLYMANMLTYSQMNAIRQKRFPKVVGEEIVKARSAQQGGRDDD